MGLFKKKLKTKEVYEYLDRYARIWRCPGIPLDKTEDNWKHSKVTKIDKKICEYVFRTKVDGMETAFIIKYSTFSNVMYFTVRFFGLEFNNVPDTQQKLKEKYEKFQFDFASRHTDVCYFNSWDNVTDLTLMVRSCEKFLDLWKECGWNTAAG